MIYQSSFNSDAFGNDILNCSSRSFLPHLHRRAELIYLAAGELTLHCNRNTFTLNKGNFALVLPNHLHSLESSPDADYWIHTFSTSLLPAFFNAVGTRTAVSPVFCCDEEALAYYKALCLIPPPKTAASDSAASYVQAYLPNGIPPLKLKAALYGVLACFLEQVQLTQQGNNDDDLFIRIIRYIAEHCKEDISLASVAKAFGYEPHYLCRYMKRVANVPFRQLVNNYRLDQAKALLEGTEAPITQIALDVGFSCLRTFNRVFKDAEGVSPREYRQALQTIAATA